MSKPRTVESRVHGLSFLICLLLSVGGAFWIGRMGDRMMESPPVAISVHAVNLNFAQMELVAGGEAPPPKPTAVEPLPPEEVDVVLDEILEQPEVALEPEPEPELEREREVEVVPVVSEAKMTQLASATSEEVLADELQMWVVAQIESEKEYPASAQRFGMEGSFDVLVTIECDGTIMSAEILSGAGHLFLRRSVERMMEKLVGCRSGRFPGRVIEIPVEVTFELK